MKKYIRSAHYTTYQGHQIEVNDGETTPQAITRYKEQVAKEESDRLEAERIAKEEKAFAKEQRRKTPKYSDGTIVLTKDGEYFQVYDGYYSEYDDDIEYDAVPCTETGKWVTPRNDWEDLTINLYQKEIQKKVKEPKSSKVTASDEISVQVFDQLVDSYKDSGAGWSLIVAELKGTYGLDVAKEVADTVCYERKYKSVNSSSRTFTKYPSNYIKSVTEADRDFKAVPLKSLKKGAWFTVKPIAEPTDKQVYIKDDYDREEKKFMCGRCDDISYSTCFKGDKLVYDDSNFEY